MNDFTPMGKSSRQVLAGMRGAMAPADQPEREPSDCQAFGCPCVASVNIGEGWQCSWHWNAPSDRWQAITQALREHQWLIDHISRMQHMHSRGDPRCATIALEFWAQQPEQQPNAHEQRHVNAYIGRMRDELRHRVGVLAKAPKRTVPQHEWPAFETMFRPRVATPMAVPAIDPGPSPALAAPELAIQARQPREVPGRMDDDAVNAALQAEAAE